MASRESGTGVKPKWPGRESHLSTGSESDVKLTVDSNIPILPSTTRKSPPRAQVQSQQVVPSSNRPKKDITCTFENWNPMEDDYNDRSFNSYNRGPGAGLSGMESSRPGSKSGKFTLFVGSIPTEMTEEGLSNLFSHVCDITHVKVFQPRDENSDTTFGFVDVPSIKDGEEAIRRLDGHAIRNRRLKVSFKREKGKPQVEVPSSKQDSSDEWDPPSRAPPISSIPPSKQSMPKDKQRPGSVSDKRTSSSSSETDESSMKGVRKPAQPRKMEDHSGTSCKPKSSGEEPVIKSPAGSVRGQSQSPNQPLGSPVDKAGSKSGQSPLQALLLKMRSPNKNNPEPAQDRAKIQASIQRVGQKGTGQEVKCSADTSSIKTDSGVGRKIEFNNAGEETSDASMKQAFAEKLSKAGITIPKKSPAKDDTSSSSSTGQDEIKVNSTPSKSTRQPLLSLDCQKPGDMQTCGNLERKELKTQITGQSDSPTRYQASKSPHRNNQGGILGPAPQELIHQLGSQVGMPGQISQPHSPTLVIGQSYCAECAAHEHHGTEGNAIHLHHHHHPHSHPQPHHHHLHHHHEPLPRNGPCKMCSCCEGYPVEEPCQSYHHHPQPYPHRQFMHPPYGQGPRYGPDPAYGLVPPYGRFHPYSGGPTHPHPPDLQSGYYEARDFHPRGYPPGNLGAAGYQNAGYQGYKSKYAPNMRGKPEPSSSYSKLPSKTPKALPPPDDHPNDPTTKPPKATPQTDENLPGKKTADKEKGSSEKAATSPVGKPVAGNQWLTTKRQPVEESTSRPAKKAPDSALPKPGVGPTPVEGFPAGKSMASGGDSQRSLHKGTKQGQPGTAEPKPCVNCGKAGLLRCGQCKCTYCSKECQKSHWPTHKRQCKVPGSKGPSNKTVKKSSPEKPRSSTPPKTSTELLHSGSEGQFMARNLPYEIPENTDMEVLVCEVEDPGLLWVQLVQERSVAGFAKMSRNLNTFYSDPANAGQLGYKPKVGGVCVAKHSSDGSWYRAEVVSVDGDRCSIRLFDYGSMDVVSMSSLLKLKDDMLKLPKQGLKCSLSGVKPHHGTWSKEATEMLKSLLNKDKECTKAKFKGQGSGGLEVELYSAEDHTKTLSSILISAGLAEATGNTCQPTPKLGNATTALPPSLDSVLGGLPVGNRVDAVVSHVDSPGCFYVNLSENAVALLELSQEMNLHYNDVLSSAVFRPKAGDFCAARYSEDKNWYRAVVDKSSCGFKDASLPITFIDHGNSDSIGLDECRPLEARFATLPRQAVPCSLAGVGPNAADWPNEMTAAFKEWLVNGRVSILIKANHGGKLKVEIFALDSTDTSISFNALLRHSGFGVDEGEDVTNQAVPKMDDLISSNELPTPADVKVTGNATKRLPVTEPPQSEFQGIVTVINDPGDFYLQVFSEENVEVSTTFTEHLNTRYNLQDLDPYKPRVGEYCAIIFTDDAWYRALVLEYVAPESAFKVLLVDYGDISILPLDRIRRLEDRFYKLPAMALHCSLTCVVAPSSDSKGLWKEAATSHFRDKVLNENCQVRVVTCEDSKCYVELLYPGKGMNEYRSVKRELIQKGWATPNDPPSSNQVDALGSGDHKVSNQMAPSKVSPDKNNSGVVLSASRVVPHSTPANRSVPSLPAPKVPTEDFLGLVTVVSDHGDVYLQVATDENADVMQSLTRDLNEHYSQEQWRPLKASVGEPCAVKYSVDNSWCRGQVVSSATKDSLVKVLFVDFGNTETVTSQEIQKLEDRFTVIPMSALHCRLSGLKVPSGDTGWHSDATALLNEKILGKPCMVHVTKHDGKICEVEIKYSPDDVNWSSVNNELIVKGLAEPITLQNHSPGPSGDHHSTNQGPLKKNSPAVSPANKNEHHSRPSSPRPPADRSPVHVPTNPAQDGLTNKSPVVPEPAKLPDGEPPPEEFQGFVACVNDPGDFHLQIKNDYYIQLSLLLREELNRRYFQSTEPPHVPRVGQLCAAMYSVDGEWYRALALEKMAPEQAFKVMFVDYGNCEVVSADKLRKLEGDLLEVPCLSRHCCLSGVVAPSGDKHGPWPAEAAAFISRELIERGKECHVKLVKHDGKMCEVELLYSSDDGAQSYSLKEELLRKGLAKPVAIATAQAKETRLLASSLQRASLPMDSSVRVTVTEVVSPQEFYCQMVIVEEIEKLQSLMEEIKNEATDSQLTASPAVGDLCLSKFTVDDIWYRAEILKINRAKEKALVYYVDFGNKEPIQWSRLVTADEKFAVLPMQAIRCGLQGVSPDIAADEKTTIFLRDLILDPVNPKFMMSRLSRMLADGTSLVTMVDQESGMDINQAVRDHFTGATSPGPSETSQPSTFASPTVSVVSPRASATDPAKIEALKREMDLKKRQLEEQIEAQRRELAEVEQLRASLEQGL